MIDLSETSDPLLAVGRMTIESSVSSTLEETDPSINGRQGPELAYILYPRIAGLITMISSLCIMVMAWKRRKFLFHRLVLAMSIHQLIYGFAIMLGTLPIPREREEYVQNYGTMTTCTIQGFFIYFCGRCAVLYYAMLSIYSYVGFLSGFEKEKYQWVENLIHIFVPIYPGFMAVYYFVEQGFNPVQGFCSHGSYPMGCDKNDTICERGPDNYQWYHRFLIWLFPVLLYVGVPTITMIVLYCKVKRLEANPERGKPVLLESRSVALQSCAYLSVLYWTTIPFAILGVLQCCTESNPDALFPFFLATQINFSLFAFWSLIAYRYFSTDAFQNRRKGKKNTYFRQKNTAVINSASLREEEEDRLPKRQEETTTRRTDPFFSIFKFGDGPLSSGEMDSPTTKAEVSKRRGNVSAEGGKAKATVTSDRAVERHSFNIFDGTNSSSFYADFVFEGDSDDERQDRTETQRWATVQEHV